MKKILVIDDDQFVLKVYQSKFESEGLRAEVAADPASALDHVRRAVPDLILLDLMLPGMNGVELLKEIRKLPGTDGVPVLVFTHSYDTALIDQAKVAGADVCLNKNSVSPNRLMEMVRHALAQGRRQALRSADAAIDASEAKRDKDSAPESARSLQGTDLQFFRGDLRARMVHQSTKVEGQMRELVQSFSSAPAGNLRMGALAQISAHLGDIIHDAVDADLFDIVMMGRALAGMTSDLEQHPEEISQGTFKTFGNAVITLANLYKRIGSAPEEHELPGLAVIALPNSQAGSLITDAFLQVTFPAVSFSDPTRTVDFLKEKRATILVSAEQWPEESGADLFIRCSRIEGLENMRGLYLSQDSMPAHHGLNIESPPILYLPYTAEEVVVNALCRVFHRR